MTFDKLIELMIKIENQLDRIEAKLDDLNAMASAPSIGLSVTRLSSTMTGNNGQVIPGSMILQGTEASEFFRGLGHATMVPLSDLPPWTHMALAQGSWWLIQMA